MRCRKKRVNLFIPCEMFKKGMYIVHVYCIGTLRDVQKKYVMCFDGVRSPAHSMSLFTDSNYAEVNS